LIPDIVFLDSAHEPGLVTLCVLMERIDEIQSGVTFICDGLVLKIRLRPCLLQK
jgi:hypothetical protein